MIGYRLKDGVLTVVPEEAEIVRQIFKDYLSGMGENAIAKKLIRMGVTPMRSQRPWNRTSIRYILTNEKYSGNMLLQKTYTENYISKKPVRNHGERTQYLVENSHEAIISKAMFDAAQAERQKRREKMKADGRQGSKRYPFSGVIECGECGMHYRRRTVRSGTSYKQSVWICRTFDTYGKEFCHSRQIPEDILIAETIKMLGRYDLATAVRRCFQRSACQRPTIWSMCSGTAQSRRYSGNTIPARRAGRKKSGRKRGSWLLNGTA